MSKNRIILSKALAPSLEVRPAPTSSARRWCSKYESEREITWPTVFMTQQAYQQVNDHANTTLDLEVGGMLVGQPCLTPDLEPYIVVSAALEALHVDQSSAHLTFTSTTLADVLQRLEETYPDKQIVGWYHTHPALSVFLSSMDIWLHTHFFPEPWHVALVIDPYVNHGGFFCYADGEASYLHPKHYVGFYEVLGPQQNSLVSWYNLKSCQPRKGEQSRETENLVEGGL